MLEALLSGQLPPRLQRGAGGENLIVKTVIYFYFLTRLSIVTTYSCPRAGLTAGDRGVWPLSAITRRDESSRGAWPLLLLSVECADGAWRGAETSGA